MKMVIRLAALFLMFWNLPEISGLPEFSEPMRQTLFFIMLNLAVIVATSPFD